MLWVVVFVGIGLAGLIMLICYAVWLTHKASDLWSEIDVLSDRADQLAEMVGQIRFQEATIPPDWRNGRIISAEIDRESAT